jgi:hypothetical protein
MRISTYTMITSNEQKRDNEKKGGKSMKGNLSFILYSRQLNIATNRISTLDVYLVSSSLIGRKVCALTYC